MVLRRLIDAFKTETPEQPESGEMCCDNPALVYRMTLINICAYLDLYTCDNCGGAIFRESLCPMP